MLTPDNILVGTMALAMLALVLFVVKNDELLGLFVFFFYTSGLNRYNLVTSGAERWVRVAYSKNIFSMTDEIALVALNYFFLGTAVLSVAYFTFSMFRKAPERFKDDAQSQKSFLSKFLHCSGEGEVTKLPLKGKLGSGGQTWSKSPKVASLNPIERF